MKTPRLFGLTFASLLLLGGVRGPAADLAKYRTGTLEPRVRQVPEEIQEGVFTDPAKYRERLVKFLVAGETDPYRKVKLLHDWIADNIAYDVESYFATTEHESSGTDALERRVAVCHGYGSLMEEMCEMAGVPCRTISGHGRGYRFASGNVGSADLENHLWNAVYIDGRWHLVDVTWDAGHVEEKAFEKRYATTYLFLEPRFFVFTHLPKESKWQLLASPLPAKKFEQLPYLRGRFFDRGMRLQTQLSRVTRVGRSVQFAIGLTQEVELMATLTTVDEEELPRRTMVQRDGQRCLVYVSFPKAGRYRLKLYCRPPGHRGAFRQAADLDFEATDGDSKTFAETHASFDRMKGFLFSPLFLPLATDKPVTFKLRLHKAHDVSLAIGKKPWLSLKRVSGSDNVYQITTQVPAGERIRINAKETPADDAYKIVVDFTAE